MKKPLLVFIIFCSSLFGQELCGQSKAIERAQFFMDESMITASIITDTKKLLNSYKKKGYSLPANFKTVLPDGNSINDRIQLEVRGNFRREYCFIPPLKLNFKYDSLATLSSLKTLKLVCKCKASKDNDQYLLAEFLIYRIYNLLTDKSFRVRLLQLNFEDSNGNKKDISAYGFLIEDATDMAKRNGYKELKKYKIQQEATDRRQMTMVSIFEYMIGNTDWSVTGGHNTVIITSKDNSQVLPIAVPYDFDFAGLVGTDYSSPSEKLDIKDVKERLYRGYPRSMEEINEVLNIFNQQKEKIFGMINDFELLTPLTKKEMTKYLQGFYDSIKNQNDVKAIFIDNARGR